MYLKDGEGCGEVNLNLPSELTPGLHTGEVFAMQLPSGPTSEGSQILATLAVVTQVYVYVPYPGKYANAKMYVYGANAGGLMGQASGLMTMTRWMRLWASKCSSTSMAMSRFLPKRRACLSLAGSCSSQRQTCCR